MLGKNIKFIFFLIYSNEKSMTDLKTKEYLGENIEGFWYAFLKQ